MPTGNPHSPVVLDTTVVSNFASTDDLDLIVGGSSTRVVTVPAVTNEVRAGNEDPDFLANIEEELDVIEVDSDPDDETFDSIDYGEAHALHATIVEGGPSRPTISRLEG